MFKNYILETTNRKGEKEELFIISSGSGIIFKIQEVA